MVDAIFTALLGMFGFCGCDGYVSPVICEYGVPHAVLTVDVKVTDESDKPVKDIQLQLNQAWKDGMPVHTRITRTLVLIVTTLLQPTHLVYHTMI